MVIFSNGMHQYLSMLEHILTNGEDRSDRTGVGTRSVFGYQARFNLQEGFPALTTKKLHFKSIIHELLWFLRGETHLDYLRENKVTIWDEWATPKQTARFGREAGDFGPVYGHQWRNFGATQLPDGNYAQDGVDQISEVIKTIKTKPDSRRIIVCAWNPKEADQVTLPPCHTLFQFYGHANGKLSCQLYQRSADVFLGVPFNIASYALLTQMIAQATGRQPGEFVHTFGDLHLYKNHVEQARLQLSREPRPLPRMHLNPEITDIFQFKYQDFRVEGYDPYPAIPAPIAV